MTVSNQIRTYDRRESVVFLKTHDAFGGLSNMAGGYQLRVNGLRILTSEALYQACRFPHRPEIQRLIIAQSSPMTAKMKSKPYRHDSRPDWDHVRVKVMRWCLRVKLAQNWEKFSKLLLQTGDRPIVEQSRKDDFWGAKPVDEHTLVGMNVLGRLLMELRELLTTHSEESLRHVNPLLIPDFLLDGRPIQEVSAFYHKNSESIAMPNNHGNSSVNRPAPSLQASLLEQHITQHPSPQRIVEETPTTTELQPYPEYKDSGVSWLGTIPAHWKMLRAKNVFRVIDIRSETGDEELLTVSSSDGVVPRSQKTVTMFKADSYVGHKLCWPGDLVINSLWAWMQGLGFAKHHGLVSSAYGVYRPKPDYAEHWRFFDYLLRSIAYKWELLTRSKGVWLSRLQLSDPAFLDMPVLVSPPDEQAAIVRYLDHADRRIRRYIAAKRKMITLLHEQKQAIIHRAVTRGLDPNVRLKPSGVEWLGDVPEHWEVRRLRFLTQRIEQGISPQAEALLADNDSWGVLKAGCVNGGVFRESEHKRLPTDFPIDPTIVVRVGDVLISRASGSPKLVGSVGRVMTLNYHLILSDKMFRPVFKDLQIVDFAVAAMNTHYFRTQVEQAISGAEGLANNLPLSELKDFILVIPPSAEAVCIANALKNELKDVQQLIDCANREIELIREYRTRLIADVVTGKVDVRAAAALLPDEEDTVEEAEALVDEEALSEEAEALSEE